MIITFVCTGNTCRSAMAEGICKKLINDRNITDVTCGSCGIYAFAGDEATALAIRAAKGLGVDISEHRARPINQYIIDETDIMVCMTENHRNAVMKLKPKCTVLTPDGGISDPYGFGAGVYEKCAAQIYEYVNKLLYAVEMKIVPFEEKYVEQIAEIEKQCFSAPWSVDGIKAELTNNTSHFLVAVTDEKVLGYIGVHEICSEAYIANIAVSKNFRRLHIGERLVESAVDGAKQRNCEFISLEVRKSNKSAITLYEKAGFNKVGERIDFYTEPKENGNIMTLYFDNETVNE